MVEYFLYMAHIVAIVAYLASVYISREYCDGYWVVGPVFAAAALIAHYGASGLKVSFRHALFLVASTLVYALVYWIYQHGWDFRRDEVDMLIGSLSMGVVAGSILMPALHAFLFDVDMKKVRRTAGLLIVSWYLVIFVSKLDNEFGFPISLDYTLLAIAAWQAVYLSSLKLK